MSCRQRTYRFIVAALIALLAILPIQACRPQEASIPASAGPSDNIIGVPPEMPAPPKEEASLLSQVQTIRFERISGQDGLSQNTILSILQDGRGFMWFGTEGGLNKYDGYHFTVYKHDPDDPTTLSDNYVSAIYEDPDGSLWVGTRSGLDRLDRATGIFEHYRHSPDDPTSLGGTWVVVIYEDNQGALWIGTEDGGLDRLDRDTGSFVHYRHNPDDLGTLSHDSISAIYQDRSGTLWVGTVSGLDRLDPATGHAEHYALSPDASPGVRVLDIVEDHSGGLWVGTQNGGLYRLDPASGTFVQYRHDPDDPHTLSHNRVPALREDSAGRLWVGHPERARPVRSRARPFCPLSARPGRSVQLEQQRHLVDL